MAALRIGVAWSTHFPGGGWLNKIRYRRLRYSYRAPSFVAEGMTAGGNVLSFLRFDEGLTLADLDGTTTALASAVDFFYVSSHGTCSSSQYKLILHSGEWPVSGADLGNLGPAVATFDTCDLVDLTDANWQAPWQTAGLSLRLLLGFASPATVAENSTLRGREFTAKILAGDPIGPAWLQAVHQNGYPNTDQAIALGFGDDQADADWALHDMTLADLRKPRQLDTPVIEVAVCH